MKEIKKILSSAVVGIAVACLALVFFTPIQIQGTSMLPTLKEREIRIVLKTKKIDYENIIVFNTEQGHLIKRVIGIGGDKIEIDNIKGKVRRNGIYVEENYLSDNVITSASDYENTTVYVVPDNCYFVLGDNRTESLDSRNKEMGFITSEAVIGKVL